MTHRYRNRSTRTISRENDYTLVAFMRDFPDDGTCLEWLWRNRHSANGDHAHCPKCDRDRAFRRYGTAQQRQSWTCTACGQHVHPTVGTMFERSATPLQLWFHAMYLIISTRGAISAKQLERELAVTYKTAWRIATMIRTEITRIDNALLLDPRKKVSTPSGAASVA